MQIASNHRIQTLHHLRRPLQLLQAALIRSQSEVSREVQEVVENQAKEAQLELAELEVAELARGLDRLQMDGADGNTVMASATAVAAVVAAAIVAAVAE